MTACQPISAFQGIEAAPDRTSRWYLFLVGLTLVSGTVVLVEPAPYDIAMLLLLVAGVLLNKFSFVVIHRIPILLLLEMCIRDRIKEVQAQITVLEAAIERARSSIVKRLKNQFEAAQNRERQESLSLIHIWSGY